MQDFIKKTNHGALSESGSIVTRVAQILSHNTHWEKNHDNACCFLGNAVSSSIARPGFPVVGAAQHTGEAEIRNTLTHILTLPLSIPRFPRTMPCIAGVIWLKWRGSSVRFPVIGTNMPASIPNHFS